MPGTRAAVHPLEAAGCGYMAVRLCEALRGAFTLRVISIPLEAFKAFCGLVGRHSADTKKVSAVQTGHRGIKRPPTRGGRGL